MANLSIEYGGDLGDKPSVWAAFLNNVQRIPDALALVCTHQPAGLFGVPNIDADNETYHEKPYLRWSYQSLRDAVGRLAATWKSHGFQEGSIVITFVGNGVEYVLASYAAVSLGCKFMPINSRNLANKDEVEHMVKTGLSISQGEKIVVLAGDEKLAESIDELGVFPAEALRIILTEPSPGLTWASFGNVMQQDSQMNGNGQTNGESAVDMSLSPKGGSILFTSGTTNLPKGVFHPYMNDFARIFPYLPSRMETEDHHTLRSGARFCCGAPNNHAMGWMSASAPLTLGAAVVIPGPVFDPVAMLEAVRDEKVSHTIIVPTMIHALVAVKSANPKYGDHPLSNMKNVYIGGSSFDPETMRLVTSDLGAQGVSNFWGCTEGLLTRSSWASHPAGLEDRGELSVGSPLLSYTLKIVDNETRQIVPRNVLGEIEGSGASIFQPYIGGVGQDAWYRDEAGGLWFKTGDQGRMDEQGRIFVTGRYKDMIIRGGENMSPAAIEAVLNKHPLLAPMIPQVVGGKDPIAGEIPVAVVRGKVTPKVREAVQNEVLQHMGTLYVPEEVLSTEDLGLVDYPRTTLGKVQKTKLAAMANEYLSKINTGPSENLTEEIRTIWAKAVGLDPSHVRIDAPIGEFADSITVMRVRERIKRQTGKVLSLAEMTPTGTIEKQIEVLKSRSAGLTKTQKGQLRRPVREGPLTAEDMVHLAEDPDLFEPTKKLVLQAISPFGLGWEDVEDVMPAYDFNALMAQTRFHASWRINFALQPTTRVNKKQLRAAVEAVIRNNRLLAAFLVWDSAALESNDALHVVMKQSAKYFDIMIEDSEELETLEELGNIAKKHPIQDYVDCPSRPQCRIQIYHVQEVDGAAVVMSFNHAAIDASMAQMVQEDLDKALAMIVKNGSVTADELLPQLEPHVDYKAWADSYYNLRTSIEARAATKWHVKRLKSLAEHVKTGALYPSAPRSEEAASFLRMEEPVQFSVEVPGIQALRKEYPQITATAVVKAAIALTNMRRTGHQFAVFGNLEGARREFPFLPRAMLEQHQFEATDVSGPTIQMVFNLVEIKGKRETVQQFLQRMQDEQTALTKYASAPLREIMKGLDEVSPGAGQILPRLIDTQHLNWRPGLGTTGTDPFQQLKLSATGVRGVKGLRWHAGLGGPQSQTVFMLVFPDKGRVTKEDAMEMGDMAVTITKWLTDKENWSRPVEEFKKAVE